MICIVLRMRLAWIQILLDWQPITRKSVGNEPLGFTEIRMSNIFHGTEIYYFQIPKTVVVSGILRELSPSTLKMYMVLFYLAQESSRSDLQVKDNQFAADAGISPNSIRAGRSELAERGLVQIEATGGGCTYVLCDPATKEPIPKRKTTALPTSAILRTERSPARRRSTLWSGNFFQALTPNEKRRYFEMQLPSGRKTTTGGFMAQCPFHCDSHASLKVETETGRWYCHGCKQGGGILDFEMRKAGCDAKTAVAHIADVLGRRDLIRPVGTSTAEHNYDYLDEVGELLYQIRRYQDKKFGVFCPKPNGSGWKKGMSGVHRVLYRLPEVIKAFLVILNEGEKQCDRCKELFPETDIAATTNPFGANSWRDEYAPFFKGKGVFIIPDNDEAGRRHADTVARSIASYALEIRIVNLPDLPLGGDVIDYLDKHSKEEFMAECANTPPWKQGVTP
jgi:hypothetical protein